MTYFGTRLQYLRTQDGVTQKQLADAIGVSKQTVSMWECGDRNPTFENIEAVADYFNVNMSTFFLDNNAAATLPDDSRQKQFADLFSRLSDDQQNMILLAIKGLLSEE